MSHTRFSRNAREPGVLALTGCVLFFAASIGFSQVEPFSPADFGIPNRLQTVQVALSDLPPGRSAVAVRCQALIEQDGGIGMYYCLSDDPYADRRAVSAVINVIPEQVFVPAKVDGESVRALMSFAVFIDCTSEPCSAEAARNHGYHLQELGFDYVSPQPILKGDGWYDGFDHKLNWIRDWMPRWPRTSPLPFIIAADISKEGLIEASCLYWSGGDPLARTNAMIAPLRAVRAIENAVESMGDVQYIPGFYNGERIELRLFEYSVTPNPTESRNNTAIVRRAITVGCE